MFHLNRILCDATNFPTNADIPLNKTSRDLRNSLKFGDLMGGMRQLSHNTEQLLYTKHANIHILHI